VGTFRADATDASVSPTSLMIRTGENVSVTFSIPNPAPQGGLLLDITTDVPESVIMPEVIVPDNLKSGVTKTCRYEPELNLTYAEFARHYGCVVLPARVRHPKDKAKVEVGVQVVERWILIQRRGRRERLVVEKMIKHQRGSRSTGGE